MSSSTEYVVSLDGTVTLLFLYCRIHSCASVSLCKIISCHQTSVKFFRCHQCNWSLCQLPSVFESYIMKIVYPLSGKPFIIWFFSKVDHFTHFFLNSVCVYVCMCICYTYRHTHTLIYPLLFLLTVKIENNAFFVLFKSKANPKNGLSPSMCVRLVYKTVH